METRGENSKNLLIQKSRMDDAVLARLENDSEMEDSTHTGKHIPAALDEGKPVIRYSVRFIEFDVSVQTETTCCVVLRINVCKNI